MNRIVLSSPPGARPVRAGNGASDRAGADWAAPLERALWSLCGVALLGDFVLFWVWPLNRVVRLP